MINILKVARIIAWSFITIIFFMLIGTPPDTPRHPNMSSLSPRLMSPGLVAVPSIAGLSLTQAPQLPPAS